ncbi:unnamed protein product, partial [Rotaria sordida]
KEFENEEHVNDDDDSESESDDDDENEQKYSSTEKNLYRQEFLAIQKGKHYYIFIIFITH